MRSKHKKQLFITAVAYLFFASSVGTPRLYAAAGSAVYTDLLPVGAASDTTVISNGSGWKLTTLPPTQTLGDSLSRVVDTVYQSTNQAAVSYTGVASTFTALPNQGFVGSATFPAGWVAVGRSIRITSSGFYTAGSSGTWTWDMVVGTTTILTTGAQTSPISNVSAQEWFKTSYLITVATVGVAGTANVNFDINVASGSVPRTEISYGTYTNTGAAVDWTSQLVLRPRITWGNPTAINTITFTNVSIELMN